MDKNKVVEITRIIANKIIKENGEINLFMLIPDIEKDTFTLFVSAKWLDNLDVYEGTKRIVTYLFEYDNKEYIKNISRVSIARSSDPGVLLINMVQIKGGMSYMYNCTFNDVLLPEAIVFESNR